MNNFKNMKIEVNAEQPLEETVRELERLGYVEEFICSTRPEYVFAYMDGTYIVWGLNIDKYFPLTTLDELKET